jgi:hypothetical protein
MTRSAVASAARAARRFRVEPRDEGILLVDQQDAERTVELRRSRIHLIIEARLHRLCKSLVPGGLERWLAVEIVRLELGSEGDSSAISIWPDDEDDRYAAENAVFGIDGPNLEHIEVTHAQVVDLDARDEFGYRYIERAADSPQSAEEVDPDAEHEEDHDLGPVADLSYHAREDGFSGYRWSAFVLTVGFPEPQFSELVDACVAGRADTLVLECSGNANTTGWAFQSARDLIVSAGEPVRLRIEAATVSAPVCKSGIYSQASDNIESAGREAEEEEWGLERSVHTPRAPAKVGLTLLTAAIAISLVSALFGADAVSVLTIGILGAAAALIATVSSLTTGVLERLAVLADVMLQRR